MIYGNNCALAILSGVKPQLPNVVLELIMDFIMPSKEEFQEKFLAYEKKHFIPIIPLILKQERKLEIYQSLIYLFKPKEEYVNLLESLNNPDFSISRDVYDFTINDKLKIMKIDNYPMYNAMLVMIKRLRKKWRMFEYNFTKYEKFINHTNCVINSYSRNSNNLLSKIIRELYFHIVKYFNIKDKEENLRRVISYIKANLFDLDYKFRWYHNSVKYDKHSQILMKVLSNNQFDHRQQGLHNSLMSSVKDLPDFRHYLKEIDRIGQTSFSPIYKGKSDFSHQGYDHRVYFHLRHSSVKMSKLELTQIHYNYKNVKDKPITVDVNVSENGQIIEYDNIYVNTKRCSVNDYIFLRDYSLKGEAKIIFEKLLKKTAFIEYYKVNINTIFKKNDIKEVFKHPNYDLFNINIIELRNLFYKIYVKLDGMMENKYVRKQARKYVV